jgi:hypothetical protein
MEPQSVSAQLYFKQLSNQKGDPESDKSIEEAFQKQLDLSEYYKSKYVFDTMKRDYMDKTMEGSDTPSPEVPISRPTDVPLRPTPKSTDVGTSRSEPQQPPAQTGKSTFGKAGKSTFGSGTTCILILLLLILAAMYFLMK